MMQAAKKCSGYCKQVKSLELFNNNKRSKDGKNSWCKECTKQYGKAYYLDNKNKIDQRTLKRYHDNKEHVSEQRKQYYKDNRESILDASKAHYDNNKEKKSRSCKLWRKNNKEAISAQKKVYLEQNRDTIKAKQKAYVQNNKGIVNAQGAKRRAARLQRTVAWADLEAIKQVYAECEEINIAAGLAGCTQKFVVDHIIPMLGTNVSGLHISANLQIITQKENGEKHNHFDPVSFNV